MLLSRTAYRAKATECDRMAAAALEPKLKTQHSIWAGYYRFMAVQVAKLEPDDQAICDLKFHANVTEPMSRVRHASNTV